MDFFESVKFLLSSLIYKLPILFVLGGATVYCVINFSKNPPINRRVLGGLLVLLLVEFLSFFTPLLNIYLLRNSFNQNSFAYLTFFIGFLLSLGFAVGLGLILSAIWTVNRPERDLENQ